MKLFRKIQICLFIAGVILFVIGYKLALPTNNGFIALYGLGCFAAGFILFGLWFFTLDSTPQTIKKLRSLRKKFRLWES